MKVQKRHALTNADLFLSTTKKGTEKRPRLDDLPSVPFTEHEMLLPADEYQQIGIKPGQYDVDILDGEGYEEGTGPPDPRGDWGEDKVLRQDGKLGKPGVDDLYYGPDWNKLAQARRNFIQQHPDYKFAQKVAGLSAHKNVEQIFQTEDLDTRLAELARMREEERRKTAKEVQEHKKLLEQISTVSKEITGLEQKITSSGFMDVDVRNALANTALVEQQAEDVIIGQRRLRVVALMRKLHADLMGEGRDMSYFTSKDTRAEGSPLLNLRVRATELLQLLLEPPEPLRTRSDRLETVLRITTKSGQDEEGNRIRGEIDEDAVRTIELANLEDVRLRSSEEDLADFGAVMAIGVLAYTSGMKALLDDPDFQNIIAKGAERVYTDMVDVQDRMRAVFTSVQDVYEAIGTESDDMAAVVSALNQDTIFRAFADITYKKAKQRRWLGAYETHTRRDEDENRVALRTTLTNIRVFLRRVFAEQVALKPLVESRAAPVRLPQIDFSADAAKLLEITKTILEALDVVGTNRRESQAQLEERIDERKLTLLSLQSRLEAGTETAPGEDVIPYRHRSAYGTSSIHTGVLRLNDDIVAAVEAAHDDLVTHVPKLRDVPYERFQRDRLVVVKFARLVAHQLSLTDSEFPAMYRRDREMRTHAAIVTIYRWLRDSVVWDSSLEWRDLNSNAHGVGAFRLA
jgi:hypothetical protein